jgi:propionyl-CoA carboxylase alpha chain
VEHPVTEAVYGVDLVALQLAVAETPAHSAEPSLLTREPSVLTAEPSVPNGHSIEVRLYAEDPANNYQPQSGRITEFDIPGVVAEFNNPQVSGIRLDSGVGAGDEIGTFYDAMIAKVIVWAPTRAEALRRLAGALAKARIHGLRTNRDFLVNLLRDAVVVEATMHTTWLDSADVAALGAAPGGAEAVALSGFAAAIANAVAAQASAKVQSRIPVGFRNVVAQPQVTTFLDGDDDLDVHWFGGRSFASADLDGVTVVSASATAVTLDVDGVRREFSVTTVGGQVDIDSSLGHIALKRKPRFVDPSLQVAAGSLLAPMPGSVVAIRATVGDEVEEGQPILVMEAMKMQHTISAPHSGVLAELNATEGQQVEAGAVLAVVATNEEEEQA